MVGFPSKCVLYFGTHATLATWSLEFVSRNNIPSNSYKSCGRLEFFPLPMSSGPTQPTLPVSGTPLDVQTWITQQVTVAPGTEAIEISDAMSKNGFGTPTEVAGLLCDEAPYKEIVELTRSGLNLRHRSILPALSKACKEVEAEDEHQKRVTREGDTSADKGKSTPAEPQLSASDIKKTF